MRLEHNETANTTIMKETTVLRDYATLIHDSGTVIMVINAIKVLMLVLMMRRVRMLVSTESMV